MNEIVMAKDTILNGDKSLIAILFQVTMVLLLLGVPLNEFVKRIKNKKRLLLLTALFTRMPLLLFLLFPSATSEITGFHHAAYLSIFLVYCLANPVILPIINQLLKHNYSHKNFGRLYSFSTAAKKIAATISVVTFGSILSSEPFAFRWVFGGMAIFSIFGIYLLSSIKFPALKEITILKKLSYSQVVQNSFRRMWRITKENKNYRDFEWSFMFYGCAFMLCVAIIPDFLTEKLAMSEFSVSAYKGISSGLSIILLPICGMIIGKMDPRRFATYTYLALFFHYLFLGLCIWYPAHTEVSLPLINQPLNFNILLLLSYISFGFFTALMAILWSIGSAYFCTTNEAADYQGIHMTLTGVRAILFPLLGVAIFKYGGYIGVYGCALVALIGAMVVMKLSMFQMNYNHDDHK